MWRWSTNSHIIAKSAFSLRYPLLYYIPVFEPDGAANFFSYEVVLIPQLFQGGVLAEDFIGHKPRGGEQAVSLWVAPAKAGSAVIQNV